MTPKLRFSILRRDGFTCRYCGRKGNAALLEVDHIDPRANDGPDTEENLVTACRPCNQGKRDARGILPPPVISDPAPYPVGMFFNVHAEVFGAERKERSDNIWAQGLVVAVQGDDVWCRVFGPDGDEMSVRSIPRNNWRGWDFFAESKSMRFQATLELYQAGIGEWSDVERFEEFDAAR